MQESLPNLFILGAAKAGTTTLYDMLSQLPEVYFPFSKEPLFFSKDSLYARGTEWYIQTYYHDASSFLYRGDATPHYLYWGNKVASRMKNVYSTNPKFIVILRDPVKRAYSWYWNMIREGIEKLSFEDALEAEDKRILENYQELSQQGSMIYGYFRGGCYASQLEPFLKLFPRESFHFILQEDLLDDLTHTMQKLLDFLEYRQSYKEFTAVRKNTAALPRSMVFQRWLHKKSRWRNWLKKLLPIQIRYAIKENMIRLNLRPVKYAGMQPETEKRLRQGFDKEISRLQEIIDRDLSGWRIG